MRILFCAFAILLTVAPQAFAGDEEIMDVDRAFARMSMERGIANAFDHYLSEDAVKLDGGAHPQIGHTTIITGMRQIPADATLDWKPAAGKIAASGDMAYTWGTYVLTFMSDGERKEAFGKYITVWEKRAGEWKAVLDGGNASPSAWDGN